jgi:asparagine synthase (glutamine-hydrolysing)
VCGIAGLVGLDASLATVRVAEAMRRLVHRGPDGEGCHVSPAAVIGMRRLAIIDIAGGGQPIFNEDRSIAAVCNGELYNYLEELPALERRGHKLQSRSDVNLIPHLYEERGRLAFTGLRGMFAAAVWDERRRRLTLARDRAGKKPLFWARVGSGLAFASELPALLALLDEAPGLDPEALADYLRMSCVPHPRTVYRGVNALAPASTLEFTPGSEPVVTPYWSPGPGAMEPFGGSLDAALEELDVRLREAVALRLRSDVPVGMFLSGGIDSGLVASYAAELGARDLLCFVVEVDDPGLDEAPQARRTAAHLGLPIETIPLRIVPREAVEKISLLYGQPYGDSSAIPTYLVAQGAARHRKVVLTGDGGDEVFAGYRRYWAGLAAPFMRRAVASRAGAAAVRAAGRWGAGLARRSPLGFVLRTARGLSLPEVDGYLVLWVDLLGAGDLARCFPELASRGSLAQRLEQLRGELPSFRSLRAFQLSDYRLSLVDDLLAKMDIATMANSLEARSPFLDTQLAEFSWSLPERWLLGRVTKPLLRALAQRRLPPSAVKAPKRGFEVPVGAWLRSELRELVGDLLLGSGSRVAALGDGGAIRRFVTGRDGFSGNHAQAVWCLLMLELFLRSPAPPAAGAPAA